jgi:hypothetical protein
MASLSPSAEDRRFLPAQRFDLRAVETRNRHAPLPVARSLAPPATNAFITETLLAPRAIGNSGRPASTVRRSEASTQKPAGGSGDSAQQQRRRSLSKLLRDEPEATVQLLFTGEIDRCNAQNRRQKHEIAAGPGKEKVLLRHRGRDAYYPAVCREMETLRPERALFRSKIHVTQIAPCVASEGQSGGVCVSVSILTSISWCGSPSLSARRSDPIGCNFPQHRTDGPTHGFSGSMAAAPSQCFDL